MNEEKRKSVKWKKAVKAAYGFTLIEVIIVIAILAIVLAIAYPSFQRIAINNNLKTAARDLAADFALLKERSIAEFRMYRLVIDVNNNNYTLQQCGNQGSVCNGWNQVGAKNLSNIAPDITFDAGNTDQTDFRFQTRGTMTPAGNVGITNSRGSRAMIRINLTGRSSVEFSMQ